MSTKLHSRALIGNLASGYGGMALVALVTIFLVPYYVHLLGPLQWGLVAQCLTLQGLLFTLEIVQGPLALRDVAHAAPCDNVHSVYRLHLRRYLLIGCIATVLVQVGWLTTQGVDAAPTVQPIRWPYAGNWWILQLALLQFFVQFANGAAMAYWSGLHQGWRASASLSTFLVLKHAAALSLMAVEGATALNYMIAMAGVSIVEVFFNAACVTQTQATDADSSPTTESSSPQGAGLDSRPAAAMPPGAGKQAGVLFFVAAMVCGAIGSQLDRLVLATSLAPVDFGRYYLATVIALSFLSLQMPIARTFLPYIAAGASPVAAVRGMLVIGLIAIVIPAWAVALLSQWVLSAWLADPILVHVLTDVVPWMLFGVSLMAIYSPFSNYLLSQLRYVEMFVASATALVVQALVLSGLAGLGLGFLAGSMMWLAGGATYLLFLLRLLVRDRKLRAALCDG